MGYQTTMTQKTRDGGIDIIAEKKDIGEREKLLIQCKKQKKDVCVGSVRELLGVKADEKATKGVLVTTAGFTIDAEKFANRNLDLELIGRKNLQLLLNKYFSPKWTTNLDRIISKSLRIANCP